MIIDKQEPSDVSLNATLHISGSKGWAVPPSLRDLQGAAILFAPAPSPPEL